MVLIFSYHWYYCCCCRLRDCQVVQCCLTSLLVTPFRLLLQYGFLFSWFGECVNCVAVSFCWFSFYLCVSIILHSEKVKIKNYILCTSHLWACAHNLRLCNYKLVYIIDNFDVINLKHLSISNLKSQASLTIYSQILSSKKKSISTIHNTKKYDRTS